MDVTWMLEVTGLSCSRGELSLFSNLSFNLNPGEGLQICAPNGAGKSTLIKVIAGLLNSGAAKIIRPETVLYLGHKLDIHPSLTVQQNLKFLLSLNQATNTNFENFQESLKFAGLRKYADQLCAELSAGQQQRIKIARLVLSNAQLWLLDEPYNNLDNNGKILLDNLCAKHLSTGGIIVLASHETSRISTSVFHILELQNYA